MVRKHKKKTRKYRGKRTFGTGKLGTRRAKGQKGGSGLTTGKEKHHFSKYIKLRKLGFPGELGEKFRLGKHGFKRPLKIRRRDAVEAINLKDIEVNLESWLEAGDIDKKKNTYVLNLTELGYDKLLGRGKVTENLDITVKKASKGAIEKLEESKCTLNLTE